MTNRKAYAEFPIHGEESGLSWPSDNEYGIPLLIKERQADAFDTPVEVWGAKRRKSGAGTYVFYTDDTRFNALWSYPDRLPKSSCVTVVEPNFSIWDHTPVAVGLWQIYRKRTMARYWQMKGVRLIVDLNVAAWATFYNLCGVPKGWKAYATRGYTDDLESLEREMKVARHHAETDEILFMVYGGGEMVRGWSMDHGLYWVPENSDITKGKYSPDGQKIRGSSQAKE